MPSSVIATAIIESFAIKSAIAIAAVKLGAALVTTAVISKIITKRALSDLPTGEAGGTQQIGSRVQLPPSTDNKIPVVYGTAFMKPIITDAKISTDQKTMWYVLTLCEAMDSDSDGVISFGDIYWGDKKLNFNQIDNTKVESWTNSDGTTETQPANLVEVYRFRDGSDVPANNTNTSTAYQLLGDSSIAEANRWDSNKKMTKLAFLVAKVKYDQEKAITSLPDITVVVNNTLNKPGSVIKNYLTNTRYGAGLDLSLVNTTSLTALDAYSDETISYTPSGGGSAQTSARYRINGPVDVTKPFLENVLDFCECSDSWLQWNEVTAQWSIILNKSHFDSDPDGSDIRQIDSANIVGGIDISPIDLNSTFNSVEVQFPNTKIKDQPGYYKIDLTEFPNLQRSPNEPDNKLGLALPYTNNIVQAQYIAARRLLQSREDLTINFTMDYSGIQIDAGDVIGVHHEQYGWGRYSETVAMPYGKLFRVQQVQEGMAEDGTLYATVIAAEYNDDVYDDSNIDLADFEPELNTGIPDPTIISVPGTPSFSNQEPSAAIPSFTVNTVIPATGSLVAVEFWYGTTSSMDNSTYTLYKTEFPPNGTFFDNSSTVSAKITGLSANTYYWRVRGVGTRRKSTFSSAGSISWSPEVISTVVGQNFTVEFTPGNISVPRTGTNRIVNLAGIQPRAYGQAGGTKVNWSPALTDNDASFANNTWRIGASSSTGYTSAGVFSNTNITFVASQITGTVDGGVIFPQAVSMPATPAYIEMPVRFKDGAGNITQGIPAFQQLTYVENGVSFYQPRIWFLAPISANTATVTGGVYDRGTRTWSQRPVTRYGIVGGDLFTVTNYDYALDVTDGNYRWSATADDGGSEDIAGTFTAVWNQSPTIEAGFGPTPAFIDFDIAGGTAFYKSTTGTITPSTISIRVNAQGINTPIANWTVSGGTGTTTGTFFTRDTIVITPTNNPLINSVQATVSVGAYTKSIILPIVGQGLSGAAASRGFLPLSYIPIGVNPNSATQAQLDAAFTAYSGLTPINKDAATFYFGSIRQSFIYDGTDWTAAAESIDGSLIVNGTIRADSIGANEIFTNNFASTNAAFFASTSTGYWLDGTSGNARFGGSVSIGRNLTVEGLINGGTLSDNTVGEGQLQDGIITTRKVAPGTSLPPFPSAVATSLNAGHNNWQYPYVAPDALNPHTGNPFSHSIIGYWRILPPDDFFLGAKSFTLKMTLQCNMVKSYWAYGSQFYIWLNGADNPGVVTYNPDTSQTGNPDPNGYSIGKSSLWLNGSSYTGSYYQTVTFSWNKDSAAQIAQWSQNDENYIVLAYSTGAIPTSLSGESIQLTDIDVQVVAL